MKDTELEKRVAGSYSSRGQVGSLVWLEIIFALLWSLWLSGYPFAWARREFDLAFAWGSQVTGFDQLTGQFDQCVCVWPAASSTWPSPGGPRRQPVTGFDQLTAV